MEATTGIGFIGGGRMAEALIKGILQAGVVTPSELRVADPDSARRELLAREYGVAVFSDAADVWPCATIILAVKPGLVAKVLEDCRDKATGSHLVISIAAGIPLGVMEEALAGSGARCIRVMPNTPALVQEGASALAPGLLATDEDLAAARRLFDAIGISVVLDESQLDAVTGLSGSGPAYVFSFIEALTDAGLKVGLSRQVSEQLVLQTILGSVKLAMETGEHPAQLRAMVTSPGGTTIAGLQVLEKAALQGMIMDAVEAATHRSRQLGEATLAARQGK